MFSPIKIPKTLIFIRHPESIGNAMSEDERAAHQVPNHRYHVTLRGKTQAKWAAAYVRRMVNDATLLPPVAFYQSTFLRTQELMSDILLEIRLSRNTAVTDSRLDEKWDGIFHELSRREIEERYPEQLRIRERGGYYHYRAPGGENCPDVEMRVRSLMHDCHEHHKEDTVLFTGHGRWFLIFKRLLYGYSLDWLEAERKNDDSCPNASVTVFETEKDGYILQHPCIVPWKGAVSETKTEFA
ncbi:MAG: hypothetical protein A2928_01850 [Candidatus Taylorbacteria bacterium RIFCSPLOWO2_01_FULL_45_15b]|uniref:Phosphoglycerate mutase n=1 Tax=Candidatus Taylorbacteria bacterium RIFCSPLOWO2_01_FULL_45_15b TaxID=1802319 RepID=A0A1G2N920_9BACT|nr:MAG: hypothetical protein A2928_01850 [Candidatus Taylorbacteria bacterium RIFCSPLOWO2_01_FULL_45_15b]